MFKYIIVLLILSSLSHFLFFGYPRETVFDEVHFGKFVSGYFTGEYFFDIHPPLGKLLISAMGWIGRFKPGFSFTNIGEKFQDNSYMWLRLLPIIAGALLPLVIFFLARELKFSKLASFATALFIIFENSLLAQSLFILLDSLLLLFGFLGLFLYFLGRRKKSISFLILSSIMLTLALAIKWTGASFLALILVLEFTHVINERSHIFDTFSKIVKKIFLFMVIPLALYFLIFQIHFSLLPKSGPGDAFMTPSFQKTLINSKYKNDGSVKESGVIQKFTELNIEMYQSNKRLAADHPYSSKWYTWPFMARPVYYWSSQCQDCHRVEPDSKARLYLIGNPFIYWVSTIGIMILLINILGSFFKIFKNKYSQKRHSSATLTSQSTLNSQSGLFNNKDKIKIASLLSGGYLLNLLPFIGIGRVMFLYHYFVALIFAVLALCFLLDQIDKKANKKTAFIAVLGISLALFIYFAPLTYGLPLTQKEYNHRVWLNGWR